MLPCVPAVSLSYGYQLPPICPEASRPGGTRGRGPRTGRSWESFLVFTTCHVGPARVPLSVPPHAVPTAPPVQCASHSLPRKASLPSFAGAEGYFGVSPRPCATSSGCWLYPCPLSALARACPCPFPAGGAAVLPREECSPLPLTYVCSSLLLTRVWVLWSGASGVLQCGAFTLELASPAAGSPPS